LAWFRREDFSPLIAIFEDGPLLDSFEQWERRAEETERWFERQGIIVERVYIDPETFPAWCAKEEWSVGREGRMQFAAAVAEAKYGAGVLH
jgi:hypothetical protein